MPAHTHGKIKLTGTNGTVVYTQTDYTGKQFGHLKVKGLFGRLIKPSVGVRAHKQRYMWHCLCVCGKTVIVEIGKLKTGSTTSCGCVNLALRKSGTNLKHGQKRVGKTNPTYNRWAAMINRCTNPNDAGYKNYGGRGITVHPDWLKFENFWRDMGDAPAGMSIERKKNDEGYNPGNCKWATWKEQCNNRRSSRLITHAGSTKTLSTWAGLLGVESWRLNYQLRKGHTMSDLIKLWRPDLKITNENANNQI